MADRSNGFAKTVRETGVPNAVQQGVVDSSKASRISAIGGAALDAGRGFVDASLERDLEDLVEGGVAGQQPQTQEGLDPTFLVNLPPQVNPTGAVLEVPTQGEAALQREGNTLRQAFESDQITYSELQARMQARTRQSISSLPGRADTFRKIQSNVLGDNSARLQPLRDAEQLASASQSAMQRELMKLQATALALGVPVATVREHQLWKLTKEKDMFEREQTASEAGVSATQLFDDSVEVAIREAVAEGGGFIDEANIPLLKQHAYTAAQNEKERLSEVAEVHGFTSELQDQMNLIDTQLDRKVKQIDTLAAGEAMTNINRQMSAAAKQNVIMEHGVLGELLVNEPRLGMQIAGLEADKRKIAAMPAGKSQRTAQQLFERKYQDVLGGWALIRESGQVGPMKSLTNRMRAQVEEGNYEPTHTTRAGAHLDVRQPIETKEDVEYTKQSVNKLLENGDEAYSMEALIEPNLIDATRREPALAQHVQSTLEQHMANLLGDYSYDARAYAQLGRLNKLSSTYQVNVEGRMMSADDIDANFQEGVDMLGRVYDAYPHLTGGMSGSAFVGQAMQKVAVDQFGLGAVSDTESNLPDPSILTQAGDFIQNFRTMLFGSNLPADTSTELNNPPGFPRQQGGTSFDGTPISATAVIRGEEPVQAAPTGTVVNPATGTFPQQVTDAELSARSPGAAATLRGELGAPKEAEDEFSELLKPAEGPPKVNLPTRGTEVSNTNGILDEIIENEGGYQNDPDDSGNYLDGQRLGTKFGITPTTYRDALGETPTQEDMKNLTEETARKIYDEVYIKQPQIDQLPSVIQANVADMGVNSGPRTAVTLLQRVLGVTPDGVIGPNTIAAAEAALEDGSLNAEYSAERINYYTEIARGKPKLKKFLRGWIKRASSFE